nr:MAG TPA: Eco47II restriction endonuclease [Caudoviricetes sp.]
MNSSSSAKTFMRMQNHLLNARDRNTSICALVEVIAKRSGDTPWIISIDSERQNENCQLRRISIDKFYEIVTGNRDAFKKLCMQLPITIENIISRDEELQVQNDTVLDELHALSNDMLSALYKLAFSTYEGF